MDSTTMTRTRPVSASAWAAAPAGCPVALEAHRPQGPGTAAQGTGLSSAGTSAQGSHLCSDLGSDLSTGLRTATYAGVAGTAVLAGVRSNEFPASPRGAPV